MIINKELAFKTNLLESPDIKINHFERVEHNELCASSLGSTLFVSTMVMITTIVTTSLFCYFDEISYYIALPMCFNFSLMLGSILIVSYLIIDGSQSSISGIVAQRLKPKSYLIIIYISVMTLSTAMLTSGSFQKYDTSKKLYVTFSFLYFGPLLMMLILIFPLIVKIHLSNSGFIESFRTNRLEIKDIDKEIDIITHTANNNCASTLHLASVFFGVVVSWIGSWLMFEYVGDKTRIVLVVLSAVCLSSFIVFMCMSEGEESNPYIINHVGVRNVQIDELKLNKNRLRIFFEYMVLITTILMINIVDVNIIYSDSE